MLRNTQMTINRTPKFSNARFNHTRVWLLPTAALAMLAGTSGALAQDGSGFGLVEAMEEQVSQNQNYNDPEWNGDPMADEDLTELNGSVEVNEYDLVDLHVNNEDLGNILQLLSIQSQRNIVSSNEVSASITADLYGVTFYEALDSILHVNGYGYIEKGNFIYVYTREQIEEIVRANRTRVTRVVDLDYLNATDAAAFAKNLLSEAGAITTTAATAAFAISDSAPVGADGYANSAVLVINDYEENADEIVELLLQLDTKPAQVLVEATILQTSLNEANAFGVDFALIKNLNFSDFVGAGGPMNVVNSLIGGAGQTVDGTDVDVTGSNGSGVNSGPGNTTGASTLKAGVVSGDVAVFMRVLDEVTDVTVVSNPKILTLNRQPARVLVGTRVGYLNTTTTQTATTQTVEFLDVGTQLSVRPFVSKNGLIRLELRPQVSSFKLRSVTDNNGGTVIIPDEDTTEMTTNVMVHDGQTVVLGGLFTETTSSSRRQVPLLGDIPLIGNAFKGYDDSTTRSEIIFLITPSIVNDTALAEAGDMGNQYVEHARFGGRNSLLPWSRERRVGQLLIDARNLAEEGQTELAISKVDRALRLNPMSPDARQMRSELTNSMDFTPSRSIIDGVLEKGFYGESVIHTAPSALDQIAVEIETTDFETTGDFESDSTDSKDAVEPEIYAEVPVEPLSDASNTESFEQWTPQSEEPAFVEVEISDAELAAFESAQADSFASDFAEGPESFESETFAPQATVSEPEPFEPQVVEQFAEEGSFENRPLYTEITDELPFEAMSQNQPVAEFVAEPATESPAVEPLVELVEVSEPATFESEPAEFPVQAVAADKFSGVLIIPLPGGGALQLDWPMSISDWTTTTFTSVPTDSE